MLNRSLKLLGFGELETTVYASLLKSGPTTAGMLSKRTGIRRTTLYGSLSRLAASGLISEITIENVKEFCAASPAKISLLLAEQAKAFEEEREYLKEIVPKLSFKNTSHTRPKLELFEGKEAMQTILKDMLLYYNLDTVALWPIELMQDVLSPEFFRYFNRERILNNLYTRAIWSSETKINFKKYPWLGVGESFKREIRIAPVGIDFPMGYWVYGNKIAFVSSAQESFGFTVESTELAKTLTTQFELVWQVSKPVKVSSADTASFLEEVRRERK